MARRLKPLKRFQDCGRLITGLKPGVNEMGSQTFDLSRAFSAYRKEGYALPGALPQAVASRAFGAKCKGFSIPATLAGFAIQNYRSQFFDQVGRWCVLRAVTLFPQPWWGCGL